MHRLLFVWVLALSGVPAAAAPVPGTEVDLELVLAVDVSRSMDVSEQRLQRDGYADAFRHPEVIQAIRSSAIGRIAVTYLEWAGPRYQSVVVPWTSISSAAEGAAFADRLAAAPIMRETGTSISGGLDFSARQFDGSGFTSYRRTIDVSGDGPNNMGGPVVPARDAAIEQGITINGLPIMIHTEQASDFFSIPNLDAYYRDCVIGGPGAFMVVATDIDNFAAAIRRKLVNEIAALPVRAIPVADIDAAPADCMAGEKRRPTFFDFDR